MFIKLRVTGVLRRVNIRMKFAWLMLMLYRQYFNRVEPELCQNERKNEAHKWRDGE